MSYPDETTKGVKTLGIRLKPDVHAQLSFIAQLRGGSITDEIQAAIVAHIQASGSDPELKGKADAVRAEMEREAAARQEAIATLFATGTTPDSGTGGRSGRRSPKAGDATPDT